MLVTLTKSTLLPSTAWSSSARPANLMRSMSDWSGSRTAMSMSLRLWTRPRAAEPNRKADSIPCICNKGVTRRLISLIVRAKSLARSALLAIPGSCLSSASTSPLCPRVGAGEPVPCFAQALACKSAMDSLEMSVLDPRRNPVRVPRRTQFFTVLTDFTPKALAAWPVVKSSGCAASAEMRVARGNVSIPRCPAILGLAACCELGRHQSYEGAP